MAFNGSGTFVRLYNWVTDAAAGIKILASRMDGEMDGMATGLSTCITKNGQTTVTANLPMATFRHTGVGSATALTDYSAATQVVNGVLVSGTIAGTDTLTITTSITPSAYAAKQYLFGIAAATNTGAVTLNWNSLGARAVKKGGGNALVAGDIVSGQGLLFLDDGTDYELLNPASVTIAGTQTITGDKTFSGATAFSGLATMSAGGNLTPAATPATTSLGYLGAPVVDGNSAYNIVMTDAGKTIYHNETNTRTWTIPANGSVAFPIGTVIVLDNTGNSGGTPGAITLAITTDTLRRGDGTAGTGSRTIGANQVAAIRKATATEWVITGAFS